MTEEALLTKQFVDDEQALRRQGDRRIAVFIGQPLNGSGEPLNVAPVYTSLIDLVNGETLLAATERIDRSKNSIQTVSFQDNTTLLNPKSFHLSTNIGRFGLYQEGEGFRINVNTVSSTPFVKSIGLIYGIVTAIGAATAIISGITTYSERVELSTTGNPVDYTKDIQTDRGGNQYNFPAYG